MEGVISSVKALRNGKIEKKINSRIREFKQLGKRDSKELFKEMCFCILTANFTAEGSMVIQQGIGNGFLTLPEKKLAKRLRELGHRFPNTRASYIVKARKHKDSLREQMSSLTETKMREWLVENIKGLGYKESSHFLRNIGCKDLAILDFHIIDFMVKNRLLEKPKTLTRKRYLEIENMLRKKAKKLGITLAELDLYLWYRETGKVLK